MFQIPLRSDEKMIHCPSGENSGSLSSADVGFEQEFHGAGHRVYEDDIRISSAFHHCGYEGSVRRPAGCIEVQARFGDKRPEVRPIRIEEHQVDPHTVPAGGDKSPAIRGKIRGIDMLGPGETLMPLGHWIKDHQVRGIDGPLPQGMIKNFGQKKSSVRKSPGGEIGQKTGFNFPEDFSRNRVDLYQGGLLVIASPEGR